LRKMNQTEKLKKMKAVGWKFLTKAMPLADSLANTISSLEVMSAKRVGSYFVLMPQWGMLRLPRPKEIHHAPF